MSDDHDLRARLTSADPTPRPGFDRELRARLSDEWYGRAVSPAADRSPARPWWTVGATAAAVVALVVTGLVWFAGRDDHDRIAPPTATLPAPAPTGSVATVPASSAPATTVPGTTSAPPTSLPMLDREGGVDGPVMYWRQRTDGVSEEALVSGVLTLAGDVPCLHAASGTEQYPLLWEYGTRWDPVAEAVVLPDGGVIRRGEPFEAGGGYHATPEAFTSSPAVLERVATCAHGELFVVQGGAHAVGQVAPRAACDLSASGAVDSLVAARHSGGTVALSDCLDLTTSDRLTGAAPYCWEECAPRVIGKEQVGEGAAGTWYVSFPISYATADGHRDVVESWEVRADGARWSVALTSAEPPLPERAQSLATVNAYLAAIRGGEWLTAAGYLTDGGADLPDRYDLLQMGVTELSDERVAAALAAWCQPGCDTTPVSDDDLEFTGGYQVRRGDQTIRAAWYEGSYFVGGAPFRETPLTGAEVLAGWPAAPLADVTLLDTLPYMLPTADLSLLTARQYPPTMDAPEPFLYPRYTQVWYDTSGARTLIVTTGVGGPPVTAAEFRQPVEVPGWDTAFLVETAPPLVSLTLGTDSETVTVQGIGYTSDEVIGIAGGMQPRSAMWAGWDVLPDTGYLFAEGWDQSSVAARVLWERDDGTVVGELEIAHGGAELATTDLHSTTTREFIDIGGSAAVVTDVGGRLTVTWHPVPAVTARFGWFGPRAEFDAILASLAPVDRTAWEAYGTPPDPGRDGCMSLYC